MINPRNSGAGVSPAPLPYFASADRAQLLLNQLHEWRGTRWRHSGTHPNEMRCGVSGDCLFWVHAFKAIGALPEKLEIPDYRRMEASADKMQHLRRCIKGTGRADLVWERTTASTEACATGSMVGQASLLANQLLSLKLPWLCIGDVLLFTNGASGAHCGLIVNVCPIHFVHLTGNGLNEEPLHQAHYIAALVYVYRLLEDSGAGVPPANQSLAGGTPAPLTGSEVPQ